MPCTYSSKNAYNSWQKCMGKKISRKETCVTKWDAVCYVKKVVFLQGYFKNAAAENTNCCPSTIWGKRKIIPAVSLHCFQPPQDSSLLMQGCSVATNASVGSSCVYIYRIYREISAQNWCRNGKTWPASKISAQVSKYF